MGKRNVECSAHLGVLFITALHAEDDFEGLMFVNLAFILLHLFSRV